MYRALFLPLLAWSLIAAGSGTAASAQQAAPQKDRSAQQRGDDQVAPAPPAGHGLKGVEKHVAVEQIATCNDGKKKRDSELCAQWEAADTARDAATYSLWSLVGSSLATVLLLLTLLDTRKTSRREHRAYVRIDPVGEGDIRPGRRIILPIQLTNYGRTPALDAAVMSAVVVRGPGWRWDQENPENNEPEGERPRIIIHPDAPSNTAMELEELLTPAAHAAVMRGDVVVYARTTVIYKDVFGQQHRSGVQYEFVVGQPALAITGSEFT